MATLPKTPGGAIDAYGRAWAARIEFEKGVKKYKEAESAALVHLLSVLNKSRQSGGAGREWKMTTKTEVFPTGEDWGAIDAYVMKTGDTSVFQKRLHKEHLVELRESGEAVPGVKWDSKLVANRPTRVA